MKLFGSITELVLARFRKDSRAVDLRPNNAITYTTDVTVDLPPTLTNEVLVGAAATQTLTNKSIDATTNTLSQIANSNIATAANISATKLSNGSVTDVQFQALNTIAAGTLVTTSSTQTLTNKLIDAANNTLSNIDLPALKIVLADANKVIRRDVSGVIVSGNTLPNNSPLITSDSTSTLTNKGVDGSTNTVTNLPLTANATVLVDANKVLRRDVAGVPISGNTLPNASALVTIDSAQVLTNKDIDGGTATNTSRLTLPKDTLANLTALTRKAGTVVFATDTLKEYIDNGSALIAVGSSSGLGELNLITNPSAESDTSGWASGGGGGVSFSRETGSSFAPLNPASNYLLNITTNGSYIAYRFSNYVSLQNTKLKLEFYKWSPIATALSLELYTNTASNYSGTFTRLNLSTDSAGVTAIPAGNNKFTTTFDADSSTYYEIRIVKIAGANNNLRFSNLIVGPGIQPQGAVVSSPQSFTPTGSWITNTTYLSGTYTRTGVWARITSKLMLSGAPNATPLQFNLPTGLTIDSTIYNIADTATKIGRGEATGAINILVTTGGTASKVSLLYQSSLAGAESYVSNTAPFAFGSGNFVEITYEVPIAEWVGSGTLNLAQNDVEYVYNTDLSGNTDLTSFGYGTDGSQFGNYNSAGGADKYVQFSSPISKEDKISLEITGNGGTTWIDSSQAAQLVIPYITHNSTRYGAGLGPVSANVVVVNFGSYRLDDGATYGAAGTSWGTISNNASYKWRVRKVRAGVAVGFGLASSTASGLTKATSTFGRLRIAGQNGYGSTNTTVTRFSTIILNTGGDITYADSATLGASITINTSGLYSISYTDSRAPGGNSGLSLNGTQLSSNIAGITQADRLILATSVTGDSFAAMSVTLYFAAGDVIRPQSDGTGDVTSSYRATLLVQRIA